MKDFLIEGVKCALLFGIMGGLFLIWHGMGL